MAIALVTADQFIEKAGLQAADIPNMNVIEEFIVARDLDEYIFSLIPADVVRRYAAHLISGEPICYLSLLEAAPQIEKGDRNLQDLTHLIIARMQNGRPDSLVIDFTIQKAYLSLRGFVINDVCYAEKIVAMTDELTNAVIKALTDAELPAAGKEYTGDTSYRYYTILLLAFEDGTVQYISRGLGSDMPRPISDACLHLLKTFANHKN